MNIFYHFLSRVSFLLLLGCATSSDPGAPGFQKSYPWTFCPYTNAPWIYKFSFNDIIDLDPFVFQKNIINNKLKQDSELGYPINDLSSSLRQKY